MQKPSASSLLLFGFSLGILTTTVVASSAGSAVFSDVVSGSYYDQAVGNMYAAGIIKGYESGKFGPNDYVTRGQVAVMMDRFINGGAASESSRSSSSVASSASSSTSSSSSSSSATSYAPRADAGSFRFTTGSFKVDEIKQTMTITVQRYGDSKGAVAVGYELSPGTATATDDYAATNGTVSFNEGETTKNFTVTLVDDKIKEANETIFLKLVNPTNGASVGTPNFATLTIMDDDTGNAVSTASNANGIFAFSGTEYQTSENSSQITITVERQTGTQGSVSVAYATSNGTASAENYTGVTGTLNFGDGENVKSFTINVIDNGSINGNKTVNLTLSAPSGGAKLAVIPVATLVIVDDEVGTFGSGSVKIGKDKYTALRSDGGVSIVVQRDAGTKGTATVKYATSTGTAKPGTDYTDTSGTLTFRPGESKKVIVVPINSSASGNTGTQFGFKIMDPTGTTLNSPTLTTVEID